MGNHDPTRAVFLRDQDAGEPQKSVGSGGVQVDFGDPYRNLWDNAPHPTTNLVQL